MIHNCEFPEYSNLDDQNDFRDPDNSKLSIFNGSENPDVAYMEREAFNYIHESGVPTHIYLRTNDIGNVDEVWEEESNPIYDKPIEVRGRFLPEAMSVALNKFGIDNNVKFDIHYSRAELLSLFGVRLVRSGDIIQIPYNTLVQTQNTEFIDGKMGLADHFRVISANDTGNFDFRWLYWTCHVELLTGNYTVRPTC